MHACAHMRSEGRGYNRDLDPANTHACSAPFNQHLAGASQVLEQALSRGTLQRFTDVLQEAKGDDIEPEEDWATLSLQDALPYLCEHSPKFKAALAEIARSQGRRVAHHPMHAIVKVRLQPHKRM